MNNNEDQKLILQITDRVPALIVVYNIQTGRFIFVNKTLNKILGYDPHEFLTGGVEFVSNLIHPDDAVKVISKNQEALKRANTEEFTPDNEPIVNFEYRMRHKNGSYKWLHTDGSILSRSSDNKVEYILNISFDITHRKETERSELENIKYALDQSAIVVITEKNGMIEYVNDKFVEISQYSRDELIGKTHRVINSKTHSKDFFKHMWHTILSGKVWRGEIQNRAKDGSYYWVDTTITPLLDEKGKPKHFIAIRNDITKRKDLERQKDEFIGIASHELKTPVTSIKGYVQFMQQKFKKEGDEDSVKLMGKMDAQVNKLTSLIQDLLDVTKIETGKLQFHIEKFDLNHLVKEIVESMQLTTERHKIIIEGFIDHDVFGDRERIGQVFTNLISNAIKYSPYADKIIVHLDTDQEKREVNVCVQDFGVGIEKEKHERLFERFYRVSGAKEDTFPGLGLGLYISSEILKRHSGRIWLESQKGEGSTFCFCLPLDESVIKSQKNTLVEEEIKHE